MDTHPKHLPADERRAVTVESVVALDDTLLQYLSPLGWEHINLTGDYLWRSSAKVGAGKFRPLRPLPPA
nr:Tn3 family transposase [Rheinheimera soli]